MRSFESPLSNNTFHILTIVLILSQNVTIHIHSMCYYSITLLQVTEFIVKYKHNHTGSHYEPLSYQPQSLNK